MNTNLDKKQKVSFLTKFINLVEIAGNKVPAPFLMFTSLIVIVFILSAIFSSLGTSVTYMAASREPGQPLVETVVTARNLFNYETIRYLTTNFVQTFAYFTPLGLVMIMMLAVGVAEQAGFFHTFMRSVATTVPAALITATIAFLAVNANLISDAGIVIMPTLGAVVFKAMGRNPWIGIITGYASVQGGFGANMLIAGSDVVMSGITKNIVDLTGIPSADIHPLMNWYFMASATLLITITATFVAEKLLVKIVGDDKSESDASVLAEHKATDIERKGLRNCGIAALVYIAAVLLLTIPQGSLFRNNDGGILPSSPFLSSIVCILFFFFVLLGIVYGKSVGTIKVWADVPKFMESGIGNILNFIVAALPASIFIYVFTNSNLSTILAVSGGQLLQKMQFTGFPLLVAFIIFVCILDLFMTGGFAKWYIIGPIFLPMFSMLGFSPALTQIAYRIADSVANPLSPLDYYLPVVVGLLVTYRTKSNEGKKIGIGSVISMNIPFVACFFVVYILLLAVFYFFNLPIGPGSPIFN